MLAREMYTFALILKVFSAGVIITFLLDFTIYIGYN
jgi:hypothetical protein